MTQQLDRDRTAPSDGRQRWRPMAVGLVTAFMTLLDVSIVNVAVPSIEQGLGMGPDALQWVLSGYALAFGLMLVPAGRFGDARGRRTVFVVGLAVFTAASAAAGAATSPAWLIVARLVQGAAAGVVNPQVTGLVQQLFPPQQRSRPFGLLGAVIGISTAVGPLLGGLLIHLFGTDDGWRWVFYLNVPVGVVAIVLGWRWIPARGVEGARGGGLDPVGVVLLGAAVVTLLLPLVQERQWHGPAKWLLLPAAAVLLAVFGWWEHRVARHAEPLIDLTLFRRRSYALGALIGMLYFGGFTAIFFIFTLYLQNGLGYSALAAGLAITPFALGSAAAAAAGGRLVDRFGRTLVLTGLLAVAAGLAAVVVALHFVPGHGAPWATAVPLLVAGIGSGLVISPNQTLTLAEVPVERAGSAGAVVQTAQRIGAAVGIAGVGSVFFAALAHSDGRFSTSFRTALGVAIAFVLAAAAAAAVDVVSGDHGDRAADAGV